jgi:hypothetical protein
MRTDWSENVMNWRGMAFYFLIIKRTSYPEALAQSTAVRRCLPLRVTGLISVE